MRPTRLEEAGAKRPLARPARGHDQRNQLRSHLGHVALLPGCILVNTNLHLHYALVQSPLLRRRPNNLLIEALGIRPNGHRNLLTHLLVLNLQRGRDTHKDATRKGVSIILQ